MAILKITFIVIDLYNKRKLQLHDEFQTKKIAYFTRIE